MIIRLVKMQFRPETKGDFVSVFLERKEGVLSQPGCKSVRLFNDLKDPNIYFTYSIWDSQAALEDYRKTAFFKETWGLTKALFADKARAWSVRETPMFATV